MSTPEFQKLYR